MVAPLVKGPKREMAASACQSFPFPQALFACQVCRFLREKVSSWHELASPDSSSGLKKDPTLFEEESSSRARKPKLIGVHAEGNLRNAMFSTLGRLPTPITGKELGGHSQEREDRSVFIRVELLPR
jgi:hypothetical protein